MRNRADYENGLQRRGAITVWLPDTALVARLGLGLPIPDHTTLSRRLRKLGTVRFKKPAVGHPIHLLIDSTGLRVHVGHLRKPPKRRVWRTLHVAANADTGEILAADLTNRRTADCGRVPGLLDQVDDRMASLMADGAWWKTPCFGTRQSSVTR